VKFLWILTCVEKAIEIQKKMQLLFILLIVINLLVQIDAYPNMRSKHKSTVIGPTCTQGGHNPLPPSGTCPQSNDTFVFPGLLHYYIF
jgi:hypothetical protein